MESPDKIGNISKPAPIKCLQACKIQENANQMSFAVYPQKRNFFYQKGFCHAASHIWQVTCQDKNRKFFMDMKNPLICQTMALIIYYLQFLYYSFHTVIQNL